MFDHFDAFVRGNCSIENAIDVIKDLMGIEFERDVREERISYKRKLQHVYVSCYSSHGLIDDLDMPFSKYPIKLSFGTYGGDMDDGRNSHEACIDYALRCAKAICKKYECECMITENVQELIQVVDSNSKGDRRLNGIEN